MAVYTAIDRESLAAFLAAYDLPPLIALDGIPQGVVISYFVLVWEGGFFMV